MIEQSILDLNPLPVWVCDRNYTIVAVNQSAYDQFKIPDQGWIGKNITDLIPEAAPDRGHSGLIYTKNQRLPLSLRFKKITIGDGEYITVVASFASNQPEEKGRLFSPDEQYVRKVSHPYMRVAKRGNDTIEMTPEQPPIPTAQKFISNKHVGSWELEIDSLNFRWDEQMCHIFDFDFLNTPISYFTWQNFVHPEDLSQAVKDMKSAILTQADYCSQYRIITGDGVIKTIANFGHVVNDGESRPLMKGITIVEKGNQQEQLHSDFKSLIHNLSIGVVLLNKEGEIILANQKILDVFNVSAEDMIGVSASDPIWDITRDDGSKLEHHEFPYLRALATGKPVTNETVGVYRSKHKDRVFFQVDAVPSCSRDGEVLFVTVTLTDITQRVKAEHALRISQEKLAIATDAVKIGVWEWDIDSGILIWDDNMLSLFGVDRESFAGSLENFKDLVHPDDLSHLMLHVENSLATQTDFNFVYRIIRPSDRQERYISGQGSIVNNGNGVSSKMLGINWDVTHQVNRENALKKATEHLTIATKAGKMGMWEYNILSGTVTWDDTNRKIFGIENTGPLTLQEWLQIVHPMDREQQKEYLAQTVALGDTYDTEFRIITAEKKIRFIKALALIKRNAKNVAVRITGVNWDISEQKSYEENIRISEEKYRSIVDNQTDMICRFDEKGIFTFANKAFLNYFSFDSQALQTSTYGDLFNGDQKTHMLSNIEPLLNGGTITDPSGFLMEDASRKKWIQWIYTPLKDNTGATREVQAIGQDITKRKNLEEQSARLDKIVRESYNEIYLFNEKSLRFEYANDSAVRNLGYSREQLMGMKITDLFHYPNEMALQILLKTLRTGETDRLQLQMRHRRKDGSYYDIQTLIQQLGKDNLFVAIATDITEKLQTERRLLDTIHEKEALIKEIHHRVKNNLQLISSIVYIKSNSVSEKEMKHFLNDLRQKIHSVGLVHERLLQSETLDTVDIYDYLGKIISGLQSTNLREDLRINMKTDFVKAHFDIDTAIYCALIVNELVINAIKHAFTGRAEGTIDILLKKEETKYLLLVRDDGIVMPESINPGDSRSFGMHLLDIFVRQLGGKVDVVRGNGTEFRVVFTYKEKK